MIAEMAKKKHTELARLIAVARERAGSLTNLARELGEPPSVRTLENWEQERNSPPGDRADALIERIKKYLGEK